MTLNGVIADLQRVGCPVSVATIYRYVTQALIAGPLRIGRGGRDRSDWADTTPAEVYAAYHLLAGGANAGELAAAVAVARRLLTNKPGTVAAVMADLELRDMIHQEPKRVLLAAEWIRLRGCETVGPTMVDLLYGMAQHGDPYIQALREEAGRFLEGAD